MNKTYIIQFNDILSNRLGCSQLVMEGETPPKAIKAAFEQLGYRISLRRHHSYSYDKSPSDVVTTLRTRSGNLYKAYYRIRVMIHLST